MTTTTVFLSGGLGSFSAADIVIGQGDQTTLLFTDTMMEDEDLYRFLRDVERVWGIEIVRIADGRTPWQVFRDVRLIGNTQMDPCSRVLKRQIAKKWIREHRGSDKLVFGFGLQEIHRMATVVQRWWPHLVAFPLIDQNVFDVKSDALARLKGYGIDPPRLYEMGFHHNNCGGFCVKAGHGHFANLLRVMPDRFAFHEQEEERMRRFLNKDVAILRDRRGGVTRPITLARFRERIEAGGRVDILDIGGCECFT